MSTSNKADIWDETAVEDTSNNTSTNFGMSISEILCDDLVMESLNLEDDLGMLEGDEPKDMADFHDSYGFDSTGERPIEKRVQQERSVSPPRKRRHTLPEPQSSSPLPLTPSSPSPSTVSLDRPLPASSGVSIPPPPLSSSNSTEDLEEQYQRALQQLALSMRRSEMTRNEIIRHRREADARAKLQNQTTSSFGATDSLFGSSRGTLTASLAQSRQMLKSFYMGGMM
uniref:Uncharacterized protein n=1 Tax=Grammatophora oceanica TaxID=210454 RepID=A0A7S1Y4M4_9STRA